MGLELGQRAGEGRRAGPGWLRAFPGGAAAIPKRCSWPSLLFPLPAGRPLRAPDSIWKVVEEDLPTRLPSFAGDRDLGTWEKLD